MNHPQLLFDWFISTKIIPYEGLKPIEFIEVIGDR